MFDTDLLNKVIQCEYEDIAVYCNDYNAMLVTKDVPVMEVRKSLLADMRIFMWINQILNENRITNDTKIQVIKNILKISAND